MVEQEIDQSGNSVSGVLGSDSGKMAILLTPSHSQHLIIYKCSCNY